MIRHASRKGLFWYIMQEIVYTQSVSWAFVVVRQGLRRKPWIPLLKDINAIFGCANILSALVSITRVIFFEIQLIRLLSAYHHRQIHQNNGSVETALSTRYRDEKNTPSIVLLPSKIVRRQSRIMTPRTNAKVPAHDFLAQR